MQSHIGCMYAFLSRVHFRIVLKFLAWRDAKRHWLPLYDFSPECVSSNRLPELMHNHIGYIRTIFLQHWFSFVSSNHQPELLHSHIDCICPIGCTCEIFLHSAHFQMFCQIPNWCIITIFIQRGFSFVAELMYSHIDCICSICLHSVISYVSSKDLNV